MSIRKFFDPAGAIAYEVTIIYQDGPERCVFTGPDAEREAIEADRAGGGSGRIEDETTWPTVTADDLGRAAIRDEQFRLAARLGVRFAGGLRPGRRYAVVVEFREIEDTFKGEGI